MTTEELYLKFVECGCRVNTDSRTIKEGEMFIALKGENFDGNLFALQALSKGAGCAVVSTDSQAAASGADGLIAVPDTLEAMRDLARYHRHHCLGEGRHLTVIGLTGTNGKTTTKELIKAVLSTKYAVSATQGNLNNDIGVPQTLLAIGSETQIAIVEMGANHPDDISRLVEIVEPDFGLITNVGKAHLLGFGSFEGVQRAKGQLYDHLCNHGGRAMVNVGDPVLAKMASSRKGLDVIPYSADAYGVTVLTATEENPFLTMDVDGVQIRTNLVGAYNAANVLAAIAVGRQFGVSTEEAAAAIEAYVPSNNRSQMVRTGRNVLIVDAYNANPSSMGVALDNFESVRAARKLALLGDMRELGDDSLEEHKKMVYKVASGGYDAIFVGAEFARAVAATGLDFRVYPDSDALASELESNPVNGATVLIKGSRGIRMEKVIPQL